MSIGDHNSYCYVSPYCSVCGGVLPGHAVWQVGPIKHCTCKTFAATACDMTWASSAPSTLSDAKLDQLLAKMSEMMELLDDIYHRPLPDDKPVTVNVNLGREEQSDD